MNELGLYLFLELTIRPQFRCGTLSTAVTGMLENIPGALTRPGPASDDGGCELSAVRRAAFERWLIRAETFTARHGCRPSSEDDNGLYQWLNRARRKLAAGQIEEPFAGRVKAVLEYPDVRTHRYRSARGLAESGNGRGQERTGS